MNGNSNNWQQFFESLPGDDEGNRNMASFSEFCTNVNSDKASKLRDLVEESDTMFLGTMNGKIIIMHSPTNFGGTRSRKTNKIACLMGLGTISTGVLLNEDSVLESKKFKGAEGTKILKCDSEKEITELTKPKHFTLGAIFIPAPFLRSALVKLASKDPIETILALNKAVVEAFEIGESEDVESAKMKEEANDHIEEFAKWLYGISIKQIPEIKYEVDPDDLELASYVKERQERGIMPSLAAADRQANPKDDAGISAQLNQTLTVHAEAARESNLLRREELNRLKAKDEKEKDKVTTRIHSSVIRMIKMWASEDGERAASEIPESCKKFWNSASSGMAELELLEQLEQLGIRNVAFAHGTVVALYGGVLLYSVGGSPSNLSAFCFRKGKALKNNQNARALVLHLISEQGKGKTLDELKASAKQTVEVPSDIGSLEDQLKIFGAVLTIMAGEENPISKGIESLLNEIKDNSLEFESLIEADVSYAAKILYAVDTRTQRFLLQCKRKQDREEVNERLVDFSDLADSCLSQSFNISLPPAFKGQSTDSAVDPFQKSEQMGDRNEKRKRENENHVTNDDQVAEFKMKPEEDWRDKFRSALMGDRPFWGQNGRMCTRWHIRGDCFKDCNNKASHVGKDKIPGEKKVAMKNYIKKVRRT
jgi:hypothetical protein